jgi:hypothetical protein
MIATVHAGGGSIVRKLFLALSVVSLTTVFGGCAVRSDSIYAKDVEALLETRGSQVSQCYGDLLKSNPTLTGTVAVKLKVEEDTGNVVDPQVDTAQTTAPPELQQCVIASLNGLALVPADTSRPGVGVYVWSFQPPAAGAAAPPPAG